MSSHSLAVIPPPRFVPDAGEIDVRKLLEAHAPSQPVIATSVVVVELQRTTLRVIKFSTPGAGSHRLSVQAKIKLPVRRRRGLFHIQPLNHLYGRRFCKPAHARSLQKLCKTVDQKRRKLRLANYQNTGLKTSAATTYCG